MSDEVRPPVRFPHLLAKVNAFLLVAVLLVATFVGIVAHKQGWFVQQSTIRVVTPDALGITKGMPVKLYGFTIGSVREMQLVAGGVDVQLAVMSEHMERIPKGSRARFARESGVIGASVIEIIPGKPIAGPLADGEQLEFDRSRGISEIVEEFRRQAAPAFAELKSALSQVNRSGEDVAVILAALRAEAEQLPATHRAMRRLIQNADRATTELSQQAGAAWRRNSSTISEMPRLRSNSSCSPSVSSPAIGLPGMISITLAPMTPDSRAKRAREPFGMRGMCSLITASWTSTPPATSFISLTDPMVKP